MKASELVSLLRSKEIDIWPDGDTIRYSAPNGTLTSELASELVKAKAELLDLLRGESCIARACRDQVLPLSFAQERLWVLDQLEPGSAAYNMPIALRLRGALDVRSLQESLNEIVRRHEGLRTTFRNVDGTAQQVIASTLSLTVPIIDLGCVAASEREAEARRLAAEDARRTFDLSRGPLLRMTLLRLAEEEHVLLLHMHHIVSDGWSMAVFFRELSALYEACSKGEPSPLPELPIQYADYAVWQRQWLEGRVLATQVAYWKKQLKNVSTLQLPADRPRPALQSFRGARESLVLSKDLTNKLKLLSRRKGATPFMTLLAGLQTLFHRLTGQDDIAVGSPIAGRTRLETERLIGFFVNTLVLRTDLSGNPRFEELLARVRGVCLDAYAHQDVPFEKLLQELRPERDLSRTPFFQVFLNMVNVEERTLELPGLQVETLLPSEVNSKFDLTVYVRERNRSFHLNLVYNADLFEPARMGEMLRQYERVLAQIAENPQQKLGEVSVLTAAAQKVLPNPREALRDDWLGAIHDRLAQQAERIPEQPALVDPHSSWTYREFNLRSNQLAHYLLRNGINRQDVVAIYGHRSGSLVWAILATLKAGAAFLILDPAYPAGRLSQYIRSSKPRGFIHLETAGSIPVELENCLRATVRCSIELPPLSHLRRADFLGHFAATNPKIDVKADDLAYIAFTSGSTGVPKGILGRHGPLSHFLPWQAEKFSLSSADRFSLLSGISHDPLQREIFTSLWVGGTLCMPEPGMTGSYGRLADWMLEEQITFAHLTPALGRALAENTRASSRLTSLRYAFFVGDKLTWSDIDRLQRLAPDVRCVNYYGSTETQRAVSYYEIPPQAKMPRGENVIPIGRGIPDVQLLVLNDQQELAGIGEIGEIYIRSPHLAKGYVADVRETEVRFLTNPFTGQPKDRLYRTGDLGRYLPDGGVEIVGRNDDQIKIRGFRIEPAEIEGLLMQHPGVREAVIVTRDEHATNGSGRAAGKNQRGDAGSLDKRLIAYIVPGHNRTPTTDELRDFIRHKLPNYMVPSAFVSLDALPLTPNGKLDRTALPEPEDTRDESNQFVAPRDELELQLTNLWEKVLGTRPIGVRDNFFGLGGHSLVGLRLFHEIERAMGKKLPLAVLFEAPTIEQLAAVFRRDEWSAHWRSLTAIRPGGSRPPLFCVHAHDGNILFWRDLAHHLGSNQPFYALQAQGLDGRQPPHNRIEDMAAHYIKEIRDLQPEGPYFIGGHCLGGLIAFEMAQQLRADGDEVGLLALFDSYAPVGGSLGKSSTTYRYGWRALRLCQAMRAYGSDLLLVERGKKLAYIGTKFQRLVYKLQMSFGYRSTARARQAVLKAGSQASRSYAPKPYAGRIALFRATELPAGASRDPKMGWERVATGGLEVHIIPGYYGQIVREPRVRLLAGQLLACLRNAQEVADAASAVISTNKPANEDGRRESYSLAPTGLTLDC